MRWFGLVGWMLAACSPEAGEPRVVEDCGNLVDDDGDGQVDCADSDCEACPEVCGDALDNDGNGQVDCADPACDGACAEDCADGRDNDGDGAVDCLDRDCLGQCPEVCEDGLDNDGNGLTDCLDPSCNLPSCPERCEDGRDNDGDGEVDCQDLDCDGSCPEVCDDGRDNDGDGRADCSDVDCEGTCPEICDDAVDNDGDGDADCEDSECAALCDADEDGYRSVERGGTDCDDSDPRVRPGALEVCDGVDNDCDDLTDEEDPGLDRGTLLPFYEDQDADGYGERGGRALLACFGPVGSSPNNLDCDDQDPARNPLATEVCNGVDDNCDGLADDRDPGLDLTSRLAWHPDEDGDGWGAPGSEPTERCLAPAGWVDNDLDCDDSDPRLGFRTDWWEDLDGDGYGAGLPVGVVACDPPSPGLVAVELGEDCAPEDERRSPGAEEVCEDGIDQDCDGLDARCHAPLENEITYEGFVYASMDDIPVGARYGAFGDCQTSWTELPEGWEVAPDFGGVDDFVYRQGWSTHCMLVSNGRSYGTNNYSPGYCGCTGSDCVQVDGDRYRVTSCSRRILIRRPE